MKNLLAMMALGVLTTNIVMPLDNQNFIDSHNLEPRIKETVVGVNVFFNETRTFEMVKDYSVDDNFAATMLVNFDISDMNLENYKWFNPMDPQGTSYTKTSWGNRPYWGTSFKNVPQIPLSSVLSYGKVSKENVLDFARFSLLKVDEHDFLARIHTEHRFGLSYYNEGDKTFLQFIALQLIHTELTTAGGRMWTNYGQGFSLIK